MAGVGFLVEAAFGAPVISTSALTWTNLSTRVVSFDITRGRSDQLDQFDIGRLSIRFQNNDGALNPSNTASPYYPYLNPRTPIRVRGYDEFYVPLFGSSGSAEAMFAGHTESWNDQYIDTKIGYTNVTAYDAIGLLQQINISGTYAQQNVQSRVNAVMSQVGISSGSTGFPTYISGLQISSVSASTLTNIPALTHLRDCAIAEGATLFAAGSNVINFLSRRYEYDSTRVLCCFSNVVNSTYGDGNYWSTTTIPYEAIELRKQDSDIRNDITISLASSTGTSSASDSASIATYGARPYARSGTLHDSTVDATNQANWILSRNKTPYHRIRSITANPLAHRPNTYRRSTNPSVYGQNTILDTMLAADLRWRCRVVHAYPGSTKVLDQYVYVERVAHSYDVRSGRLRTTIGFSPGAWEDYWSLDSSSRSVLGATTRLAY